MKGFHRPTVATTVVLVVALFVLYHFALGRKGSK